MRSLLIIIAIVLGCCGASSAQCVKYNSWAQAGGQSVVTSGLTSTTKVQKSYPSATVTVYATGTTNLSSIFSNSACSTPKANPFTAASDASYGFYISSATVDLRFSGTGIVPPFTISGVTISGVSGGTTTVQCAGTNDSAALIAAYTAGGTVAIANGTTCAADSTVTFPSNVTLKIYQGGLFKSVTGQTPTIQGYVEAGPYRIFTNILTGQGAISFSGNHALSSVDPTWWGFDCSDNSAIDNGPVLTRIITQASHDNWIKVPVRCVAYFATTVTESYMTNVRIGTGENLGVFGGPNVAQFLWNATGGVMFDVISSSRPTFDGIRFTNASGKMVDRFIDLHGMPGSQIGSSGVFMHASFNGSNVANPSFVGIAIANTGLSQNHENYIVNDVSFICSPYGVSKTSFHGDVVNGDQTLSCTGCSFNTQTVAGDPITISWATGIQTTTVASITDNEHLELTAAANSTQSGVTIHFGTGPTGIGFLNSSVNAKHQQLMGIQCLLCNKGVQFDNGSFDLVHYGAGNNNTDLWVGNIAEPSKASFIETESSARGLYVGALDGTLSIDHWRNSNPNQYANGWIYFNSGSSLKIEDSINEYQPPANGVFFGFNGTVVQHAKLTSLRNAYVVTGGLTIASIGWQGFRDLGALNTSSDGFVLSIADTNITDAPGLVFQFGDTGSGSGNLEGWTIVGSKQSGATGFSMMSIQGHPGTNMTAGDAVTYNSNPYVQLANDTANVVHFNAGYGGPFSPERGNHYGFRFLMPTNGSGTAMPVVSGLYVRGLQANSVITSAYGVYVESLANGHTGITNKFAFKSFGAADTVYSAGPIQQGGINFVDLPTAVAGKMIWCPTCTIGNPCTGGGTGAWAFGAAGPVWNCPF